MIRRRFLEMAIAATLLGLVGLPAGTAAADTGVTHHTGTLDDGAT